MPKLSVIVPVYNTEKYLRECIDSILAQTFTDFELILVDDGSTDHSGAICDEYAGKDARIRVIHQENGGVTRARKNGAAYSKGDYVTYVDSDDWIDQETYHDSMLHIESHEVDVVVFAMNIEKNPPTEIRNYVDVGLYSKEMLRRHVYPRMLFDYSINCSGMIASLCNKIIRREILLDALSEIPDSLGYGEDAIAGYLCMLNASNAYICNNPYYHYRENILSISHAELSVMRARVLALDWEMRYHFFGYDIEMTNQINGHIARHTVEQVRAELIYPKEKSFPERCRTVRDFCEQNPIAASIEEAYPYIRNRKEKMKVLLIRYRMFGLLYILFRKV